MTRGRGLLEPPCLPGVVGDLRGGGWGLPVCGFLLYSLHLAHEVRPKREPLSRQPRAESLRGRADGSCTASQKNGFRFPAHL